MSLMLKIAVLSLLTSALAWAAPQCQPATLAQYIAGNSSTAGCQLAGAVYSNFKYQPYSTGGAPMITPDQIQVTPTILAPGTGIFTFTAPWSVNAGQSQRSIISYTADDTSGATSSEALGLALGTVQIGGNGWATVTEVTDVAPPNNLLQVFESCTVDACQSQPNASLQFSNFTVVQITEVVDVVSKQGTAALTSYQTSFNTCVLCP